MVSVSPMIVARVLSPVTCRTYVEQFAGPAQLLLSKPAAGQEVLADPDTAAACCWRVIRDPRLFERFRGRCEGTAFGA